MTKTLGRDRLHVGDVLDDHELELMHEYWQAANYLSVGQIYLKENALLRDPLEESQVKARLLGHWGTDPGLNLVYVHLNRLIRNTGADMIYIAGPGHGGPALLSNAWLEGTYSEVYPHVSQDAAGVDRLCQQFSWPGGVPSHVSAPTPGSIHEGGELGYSLVHAFGAAFDHPELIVACVVGDGEAETGPAAAGWQSIKFLNPIRDGAVLPILHLNGYKIANPTILGRSSDDELQKLFEGYGYRPYFIEGDDPMTVHRAMVSLIDEVYDEIKTIQEQARGKGKQVGGEVPRWPMIVMRTPKGWTGPKVVDGEQVEGTYRSHQVPLSELHENPEHLRMLEEWMRSYKPERLFDECGKLREDLKALAPVREKRMSAQPYANGGLLLEDLKLPGWKDYGLKIDHPGHEVGESTRVLGGWLRDVVKENTENFRIFCPDEAKSNRLNHVFEVTGRTFMQQILPTDDCLSPDGRVMEVLSEHLCEGWLEGYLLTGRHGVFPCYEAFAKIIDSMVIQHAKWLKSCNELAWRKPIASLNFLLSSHAWRQDHNGDSHQGPGFIDTVLHNKKSVARAYFPPDANTLLSVFDHCLRSRNYVNLVVAGKQPELQWLSVDEASAHCARGAGVWEWASNDGGAVPDVVLACAGDVPTLETVAAAWLLRKHVPEMRVRVVNVVDLMTLMSHYQHPHGMDEENFVQLFGESCPVIFHFHGFPRTIHQLIYRRPNATRFHVRGYVGEGTTTTPFDMLVMNKASRYHLVMEAIKRVGRLQSTAADKVHLMRSKLHDHEIYVREHGEDMPEIRNWTWTD
ncbi:phosphoketolase family protein [Poriferisphaera sp. WC338]|uniref:phosphoketolase family protein n=1 Tax=Poriferisphaera sp. WC338 TaxID=3425129 RepID=UPI003D81B016